MKKAITLFCIVCLLLSGCSAKQSEPIQKSTLAFQTLVTITLYDSQSVEILDHCLAMCEAYEKLFSNQIEGSDIYRINHADGNPVTVSSDTIYLLNKAINYSELSQGAFDITISPLTSLWNISEGNTIVPPETAIKEAISHIDYHSVIIDEDSSTVTLTDPYAQIDLGAIAKGYIADQLKEYLCSCGIKSAIIDLGGNILAIGQNPQNRDFVIGIQEPFSQTGKPIALCNIHDKSVVSSGIYQRYFEANGVLYHHILNPKTGFPADTGLNGVSIICSSSTDADALSTICMLLGKKDGLALINSLDETEAIFITTNNELFYSEHADNYIRK